MYNNTLHKQRPSFVSRIEVISAIPVSLRLSPFPEKTFTADILLGNCGISLAIYVTQYSYISVTQYLCTNKEILFE